MFLQDVREARQQEQVVFLYVMYAGFLQDDRSKARLQPELIVFL